MGKYCGTTRWSVNNRKTTEGSFYGVVALIIAYILVIFMFYSSYMNYVQYQLYLINILLFSSWLF